MRREALIADIRARRMVMAPHGKRARRKPPRVPRALPPTAVQLSYLAKLRAALAHAHALVQRHLLPKLPQLVASAGYVRGDDVGSGGMHDLGDVEPLLRELANMWSQAFPTPQLIDLANDVAQGTQSFQREEWRKQIQSTLQVDPTRSEPWLHKAMKDFTAENVSLIKSLPQTYFGQIETTLIRGVRGGLRHEQIARELQDRFGVAESRAKLIARDQVQKFYSSLNEARQKDLGVTRYTWRTVRDNRVRDAHQHLDGQVFEWKKPPPGGHPGEEINCRCSAEPELEEIWKQIENGTDGQQGQLPEPAAGALGGAGGGGPPALPPGGGGGGAGGGGDDGPGGMGHPKTDWASGSPPTNPVPPAWHMDNAPRPRGTLDEGAGRVLEEEQRAAAERLLAQGNHVRVRERTEEQGVANPDLDVNIGVDGKPAAVVEVTKVRTKQARAGTIAQRVKAKRRRKQSRQLVIEVTDTELTANDARSGIAEAIRRGHAKSDRFDYIRVMGKDFDLTFADFP